MSDPGRVFEVVIKKWRQLAIESWHHTVMTAYQTCVADLEAALQGSASPPTWTEQWAEALTHATVRPALRNEWQDISTAPKDGTTILATDGDRTEVVHWDDHSVHARKKSWCYGECDVNEYNIYAEFNTPTHWMPLPAPPALSPRRAAPLLTSEVSA